MQQLFCGDARDVLERTRITDRYARRADAPDRDAEFFRGGGGDLGAEAGRLHRFVRDQQAPGARS